MRIACLLVAVVLFQPLQQLAGVAAYPTGADSAACASGVPGGGFDPHGTLQSGSGGFVVAWSPPADQGYMPGATYTVTVSGSTNTFHGFLAVMSAGSVATTDANVQAGVPCGTASATHRTAAAKSSVRFQWTAPTSASVNMRVTLFQRPHPSGKYWILSRTLTRSRDAVCTAAPNCAYLQRQPCADGIVENTCGACIRGYFDSLNPANAASNNATCQACNVACTACRNASAVCLQCATGYEFIDGACIIPPPKLFGTGSRMVSPYGCEGTSCTMGVEWALENGRMNIKAWATDADWIGVGFSPDGGMIGTDAYTAFIPTTGQPLVTNRYASAKVQPAPDNVGEPQGGMVAIRTRREGSYIEFEFSRALSPHFPRDADLRQPVFVVLVRGAGNLQAHAKRGTAAGPLVSRQMVNLLVAQASVRGSIPTKASDGTVAHGVLMVVAMIVLSPIGSVVARHMRDLGHLWFTSHWLLQIVAVVLVVAGIIVVNHALGGWTRGSHQALGLTVLACLLAQVLLGAVRNVISGKPQKTGVSDDYHGPRRWIFNYLHWSLGRLVIPVLAVATIWLGLDLLGAAGAQSYLIVFVVAVLTVLCVAEIHLFLTQDVESSVRPIAAVLVIAISVACGVAMCLHIHNADRYMLV